MGKATGFQNRPRHEPVVRRRTPKLPLEPQVFFSCGETSTKMNLAQLRSSRHRGIFCLQVANDWLLYSRSKAVLGASELFWSTHPPVLNIVGTSPNPWVIWL
jgi:hypothetical protein